MSESKFIGPAPPARGLDYVWLRARGQEILEKLAGEVWTDYNEHDPGVTTLEQLCYALTELSYRAQSPIEDLLAPRDGAAFDACGQALFAPQAILSCNPVTAGDYRKLIADCVETVGNVWLTPCRAAARTGATGMYDIDVYAPDLDPARVPVTRGRVRRVYTGHRGLCEDVHAVRVLSPLRAVLGATIAIDTDAAPEAVLASVFYRVGNLLAPELRRQSLQTLLDAGETPASIFVGPALRHGFISDDQLQARATGFTLSQLTQCLIASEGVAGVREVTLTTDGGTIAVGGPTTLRVPRGGILRLDTSPAGGRFSVRLTQAGVTCTPESGAVTRKVQRLWTEHRRTFDVRADAERLLAMPRGLPIEVGSYVSIQEQYPAVYGINRYGVGSNATPARRAQAKQFKGYLMAFEQLLADSFATLEGLRELCAIDRGPRQRAFRHYLDACDSSGSTLVPDVGPLLSDSYRSALAVIGRDRDRHLERRSRFLDFVLATYGHAADPVVFAPASVPASVGRIRTAQQVRAKLRLLRHLPRVGHDRGRGGNYLSRRRSRRASGLERAIRLQLGMNLDVTPFAELLDHLRVTLRDAAIRDDYAWMRLNEAHIADRFAPIAPASPGASAVRRRDAPVAMTEELLVAGCDLGNYRIGAFPEDPSIVVVCRTPEQPAWQLVGRYDDYESAAADAARWSGRARVLRHAARRLYIIEHQLLRGQRAPRGWDEAAGFDYGLTCTAVVCLPGREADDPAYRRYVRDVLRRNAPAHIVIHTSFLRLRHVAEFERLHALWQQRLRGGDREGFEEACRALREFLVPSQS